MVPAHIQHHAVRIRLSVSQPVLRLLSRRHAIGSTFSLRGDLNRLGRLLCAEPRFRAGWSPSGGSIVPDRVRAEVVAALAIQIFGPHAALVPSLSDPQYCPLAPLAGLVSRPFLISSTSSAAAHDDAEGKSRIHLPGTSVRPLSHFRLALALASTSADPRGAPHPSESPRGCGDSGRGGGARFACVGWARVGACRDNGRST